MAPARSLIMLTYADFAIGLLSTFTLAQKCYSMDGQELGDTHKPCNPNAKFSACCALNGTDGNNDICLDSGLCQSTSGWYAGFLWANGCTDPTGKASACPHVCVGVPQQYSFNVLQCNPGSFCCRAGSDSANCCNTSTALVNTSHIGSLLFPGTDNVVNTTYYAQGTSTPTPTSNTTCPADHTAVVGGTLGGILGAALIAALVALFFVMTNRKALKSEVTVVKGQRDAALQTSADEKAALQQRHQQELQQQQQYQQQMQQHHMMAAPMYQANAHMYQPSGAFGSAYTPGSTVMASPPSHSVTPYSSPPSELGMAMRPAEMDDHRNPSELSDGVDRVKENLNAPSEKSN